MLTDLVHKRALTATATIHARSANRIEISNSALDCAHNADVALRVIARNHGHLLRARSENMFKHLLVPTDGSVLSEEAIRMAVGLAKEFDAKITGIHAIPEFHLLTYDTEMLADTRAEYAQHAKNHAERYLAFIERAATDAAVPCDTTWVESDQPYDAIIRTAQERHCDLIVIASHGRRGVKGLLIGSETQKVLIHSRIPVLVCRGQ